MDRDKINLTIINRVLNDLQVEQISIAIDDKADLCRDKVKIANEKRKKTYKTLKVKYNNKIEQIKKQNIISNDKREQTNRQKEERMQNRLSDVKSQERVKQMKLKNRIRYKEIKLQKILADRENFKLHEKLNKYTKRFFDKVDHQNKAILEKKKLFKKCFGNNGFDDSENVSEYEEEILDEPLEEIYEENECILDLEQSKLEAVDFKNYDCLQTYLERIVKFKKNFGTCEAGRYFLVKTAPLWDSLTQCVYRKSLILNDMAKDSEVTVPEGYKQIYEESNEATNNKRGIRISILEMLIPGLDYDISDDVVYSAIMKAKGFLDKSAKALELLNLVKLMLEYEMDAKFSGLYVVQGMCRRAVFEYTKKQICNQILGHSKCMIDRLQFLNKIDLIPKHLLASKNREILVEPIVYEFLTNDEQYGYLTAGSKTTLADDAQAKTRESFLKRLYSVAPPIDSRGDKIAKSKIEFYNLPEKILVENHVNAQIDRLRTFVFKQLATNLSGKQQSARAHHNNMTDDVKKLHRIHFSVTARKLAKMMFTLDSDYEESVYLLEMIMKIMVGEISKRSPKIQYPRKKRR